MRRRYHALILATVLLVSAATPVLGAQASAEFDHSHVTTDAGDTVEIPVTVTNTDSATVRIGSEAVNYVATVTLRDGNDDQTVTLRYDTRKAGHGGVFSVTDDADEVTVRSETEFDDGQRLDPGNYELAVAPGNGSLDETSDVATLVVTEPTQSTSNSAPATTTTSEYAGHVVDVRGGVTVAPAVNQTITGDIDLEPGTPVQVRLKSTNGTQFLKSGETTVTENGRFRVSFDFTGLEAESGNRTEFRIEVRADGEVEKEASGVVRTPPTNETTTTTTKAGSVPGFGLTTGVVALIAVSVLALRAE
ncbi:DUF2167 domain-containing protein [Halorussus aquaticus]|uniref:DUF2167 domain-containing protein n=1 Tax=Halorussus aquaticus TaxID=2953748 RepID=A0ABD5Q4S9_9EURY|nr:DUF2167 domain-containing protein [Halorussus aquaticus]